MKIYRIISTFALVAVMVTAAGCGIGDFDNYEKPKSQLTGAVVHEGDTIRVRSDAVELEIWEDGYEDYEKIPVMVNQDGTFGVMLFDGEYKFTQVPADGPWVPSTDTTVFTMNGDQSGYQFEVEPYVKITSSDIRLEGGEIVADFTFERVNPSPNPSGTHWTDLLIGTTRFVSSANNDFFWNQIGETNGVFADPSTWYQLDFNGSNTYSPALTELPTHLQERDYVYARIGTIIPGRNDRVYSKVHKIMLN